MPVLQVGIGPTPGIRPPGGFAPGIGVRVPEFVDLCTRVLSPDGFGAETGVPFSGVDPGAVVSPPKNLDFVAGTPFRKSFKPESAVLFAGGFSAGIGALLLDADGINSETPPTLPNGTESSPCVAFPDDIETNVRAPLS